MGYRAYHKPKPKPQRTAVDIATPSKLYIHNGTTATFAFPCWYLEVKQPVPAKIHRSDIHDHRGWPSPDYPDQSCQMWIPEPGYEIPVPHRPECWPWAARYLDHTKLVPIHLTSEEEGYTTFDVAWVDQPEGITANAYVDSDDDWVVKLDIACLDHEALEEPQVYKLTVFANSPARGRLAARRDIVALAELIVLPSAY